MYKGLPTARLRPSLKARLVTCGRDVEASRFMAQSRTETLALASRVSQASTVPSAVPVTSKAS